MNSNRWESAYKSMLYRVSHDLDAPLRHVQSFAQLIQEKHSELDEETKSWLEHVHTAAATSRRMLQDLLKLSRIHSQPEHRTPINVKDLISALGLSTQQEFPKLTCSVNLDQLRMVLGELVDNCKRYSEYSGVELKFTNNRVILTVGDLGQGISNKDWPAAIQPFQRIALQCDEVHNGMGLAIANAVIVEHEGTLSTSPAGVTIELPCI